MKSASLTMLVLSLFAAGCTTFSKQTQPEPTPKPIARSTADDVPAAVAKLLPSDQINSANAKAQAQLHYDMLQKEKSQLEKFATASRD